MSTSEPSTPASKPAVKAAKTAAPKAPAKAAARKSAAAKVAATAAPADETASAKAKKPKMVRDSFTFPKAEYAVLDDLKLRATQLGNPVKKTELLRAGLKALAALSDADFLSALRAVPSLKTGRPAKSE